MLKLRDLIKALEPLVLITPITLVKKDRKGPYIVIRTIFGYGQVPAVHASVYAENGEFENTIAVEKINDWRPNVFAGVDFNSEDYAVLGLNRIEHGFRNAERAFEIAKEYGGGDGCEMQDL